jgi:hypothetical protein
MRCKNEKRENKKKQEFFLQSADLNPNFEQERQNPHYSSSTCQTFRAFDNE